MESISVKEASTILGVTEYTVRRYIKEKMLNATKVNNGRKYIFELNKSEVLALKASSTNK